MVEMIIYWWYPLGFLGVWLSVDLVCCAILARQNHTSKTIQQAGLFCRLCSKEAWGKLAHSLLLPLFFSGSHEHGHFSSLRLKKEEPCLSYLTSQNVKKIIWKTNKQNNPPFVVHFFPLCREMPFSPSHDMFNIANIYVLSVYEDYKKILSFPINRTSSCAKWYFSLVCPNSLIN